MDDLEKGYPMTPCMDVYKGEISSDRSIENLKLIILVIGDLQNQEMLGDTWDSTSSMKTLKYFLSYASKYKARVHLFYFMGLFLKSNVKHRVF